MSARSGGLSLATRGATAAGPGLPRRLLSHDMGLATMIGGLNKDASGRSLSGSMKSTVEGLRTGTEGVRRTVRRPEPPQAFGELRRLADKLVVSEAVKEKATSLQEGA